MGNGTRNAELDTLLAVGGATQPTRLGIIAEGTTKGVAYLVGESGNAGHLRNVGLDAQLTAGQGTGTCTPALAIDKD